RGHDRYDLVIVDEETGTALEETFARDLASSQPLTLEEWRTRPFLGRLWERLAYSLRRWL
ncbi:MAG: cardiolipin synthase B, partial [Planctomycetota bacterium]